MTSADELFRRYSADYQAGKDPAAGEYVVQAEGADRAALELMIEHYLLRAVSVEDVTEQAIERETSSERGQRIARLIAEHSVADLRRLREQQSLGLNDLAERVLVAGSVSDPTAEEKEKAAGYLDRLERGELSRVGKNAWAALTAALGASLQEPSTKPSYGMTFRLGPGEIEADEMETQAAEAEVILNAYAMPSPRKWDRVDEFFLGEAVD